MDVPTHVCYHERVGGRHSESLAGACRWTGTVAITPYANPDRMLMVGTAVPRREARSKVSTSEAQCRIGSRTVDDIIIEKRLTP